METTASLFDILVTKISHHCSKTLCLIKQASVIESHIIICPIAIAYSYGTDNKIGLRLSVCLSVCLSVRVSSLSRSHFFVDFHQI